MESDQTKSKKWSWILGVIAFVFFTWLFANWAEFKEGVVTGYTDQTKSNP